MQWFARALGGEKQRARIETVQGVLDELAGRTETYQTSKARGDGPVVCPSCLRQCEASKQEGKKQASATNASFQTCRRFVHPAPLDSAERDLLALVAMFTARFTAPLLSCPCVTMSVCGTVW